MKDTRENNSFFNKIYGITRKGRFGEHNARKEVYNENLNLFLKWKKGIDEIGFGDYNEFLDDTKLYSNYKNVNGIGKIYDSTETGCIDADCVDVAEKLVEAGYNPAILNLASAVKPSGGYKDGSSAQEESLCRSSNLSLSLYQYGNPKYINVRESGVPNKKIAYPLDINYGGIYSKNVTFFRHNRNKYYYTLRKNVFKCGVITVAALCFNNRYNPAWGYQNGKVRNSRVRREFMPTLFAGYEFKIDDKTTLNAALTATIGVERYSSLDWYNAQTPTPDNYHYMPSYFVDETDIFLDVESAWRAGDTRYTQINFDRLIALNRANNGEAVYALSDRVKRTTSGALRIGATSKLEKGALSYGGELTLRRYRNFKQMLDLLGAEYSLDLDYFLEDDTTYGNSLQNNLLTPNRRIVVGDRFGYDYAIREQSLAAYATYSYSTERLNLDISAEIGYCNISRRGFYQKELFAENSLGDSRHIKLMPYSIRANFGYLIAENHFVEATIVSEGKPCDGEELFLQSQYNNRTIDYPSLRSTHSAEVRYLFQKENFAVTTTLFFAADLNNTSVRHSYFDLSSQYADIVISGDNHLRFGLEAEAEYRFAEHFRLTGAFSIARYQYANTPSVTIYSDSSNQLIANQTKSQIKGLSLGNMPQAAATLGLSYFNRGWMANLNMNYAGLRFVEPSQLMRTVRVLTIAYSPEQEAQLMSQERLKDSFTIDLSISKTVRLSRLNRKIYNAPIKPRHKDRGETNRLIFRVGVRNLIGSSDIVYNGYESSRLQRYKLANKYYYNRQDTRYTYCYPRTFYVSATIVL